MDDDGLKYEKLDAKERQALVLLLRDRFAQEQLKLQLQRADRPGPATSRKGYGPTEPVPPKDPFKWG